VNQERTIVQAVVFDLFETLVTESGINPTRAGSLGPVLGLEPRAYKQEWKARRPRVVTGEIGFADALIEISELLNGTADPALARQLADDRIREKCAAFDNIPAEIASLVHRLAGRGLKLGVISNGFAEDVQPWAGCALAPRFARVAFSCYERCAKPEPQIYRRMAERLDADPARILYIGDGGDDELNGADRAGLRACRAAWFVPEPPDGSTFPVLRSCADVWKYCEA
jgi:putative hydrolase of the HAD superfamily